VSPEETSLVPRDDDDAAADFADLGALFASVVPVVGSAVSFVLSDWTAQRRYQRVRDVLKGLAKDLQQFKGDVQEEYVRSDEFTDLLDQTLRRVANERHDEKRRLYRGVLLGAITGQGQSYDEHLHMLRVIDSLQVAHMALLKAILQVPDPKYMVDGISGSFIETLKRRLPELSEARIEDLVAQLKDHRILTSGSLKAMITARGAEDMRHTLSPFGRRLVSFLSEGPQGGTA
jgi:hypothetical protein